MAPGTRPRVFTVEEANRAIPALRKAVAELRRKIRQLERLEARLEILDLLCDRSVGLNNPDLQQFLRLKVSYHRKISEFDGRVREMERDGYVLRDLHRGIVHLLGRRGRETVFLCWREGEKEIRHWHALGKGPPDEARRQPIRRRDGF